MKTMVPAVLLAMVASLPAQEAGKAKRPKAIPDPVEVETAIRKGVEHLKKQALPDIWATGSWREIVLLTFLHGGLPESDPEFQKLLKDMLERPLERTYNVSLQAMILEELDCAKYQARIWQCAQFLVDNQCANGQWAYGEPTTYVKDVPTGTSVRKDVATTGGPRGKAREFKDPGARPPKPKPVRTLPVQPQRSGPRSGDHSNSQYAALGLRACHDSGIVLPRESVERARKWWRDSLDAKDGVDGGRGWSYQGGPGAYGSMTAGGLGSLVICNYILAEPWMKDEAAVQSLQWLDRHWSVMENPRIDRQGHPPSTWHYYYLYAVERAGMLYGTETFGRHDWYVEGAQHLLKAQRPDGSWDQGYRALDTCWAILFLKRSTRPIDVASVDRIMRK